MISLQKRFSIWTAFFVALWTLWQAAHLRGVYWDSDEGLNLIKARLLQLGDPLYSAVWSDQPPGLTVLLAGAFDLFGATVPVGRGVVLVHAVIALIATAWLVRELGGGALASLIAVMALALSPNFFWASRAVMISLPALSLLLLALALLLAGLRRGRRSLLFVAGLVLGLSLLEKLLALVALPAIAVAVGMAMLGRVRRTGDGPQTGSETVAAPGAPLQEESPRDDAMAWACAVRDVLTLSAGVFLPLAAALLTFSPTLMLPQVLGGLIGATGAYDLDRADNLAELWLWLWGDHRFLLGFASIGLGVAMVRVVPGVLRHHRAAFSSRFPHIRFASVLLVLWLVVTLWGLVDRAPLWPKHHFLSLLVILAPLAGLGAEAALGAGYRAWQSRGEVVAEPQIRYGGVNFFPGDRIWAAVGLVALLVALSGLPRTATAVARRVDPLPYKANGELPRHSDAWRRLDEAVAMVRRHTEPEDVIVTDHVFAAFVAGRRVPPDLAVISGKRIATGALTAEDVVVGIESARPAAILLWDNDRLRRIDGVADAIAADYRLVESLDGEWELWKPAIDAP